eukprot:TRINITY_DN3178_c0_g1_i2.p1 TRINITY_DN3178_c0_g1~~TRINITY_DN3178_c0_g1_i2.p1  ORF type:complete len:149 (-),score=6.26 TRINITY_DN3178_c0_g1_i2:113-529(-)
MRRTQAFVLSWKLLQSSVRHTVRRSNRTNITSNRRYAGCGPIRNPGRKPIRILCDQNEPTKYICRCGQSAAFPICDKTHISWNLTHSTKFSPYKLNFENERRDLVSICACGLSEKRKEGLPYCDGSHKRLAQSAEDVV